MSSPIVYLLPINYQNNFDLKKLCQKGKKITYCKPVCAQPENPDYSISKQEAIHYLLQKKEQELQQLILKNYQKAEKNNLIYMEGLAGRKNSAFDTIINDLILAIFQPDIQLIIEDVFKDKTELLQKIEARIYALTKKGHTIHSIQIRSDRNPKDFPDHMHTIPCHIFPIAQEHFPENALQTCTKESLFISAPLFQYQIISQAKTYQKHIVLPESEDDRIIQAASLIAADKIGYVTLLGNKEEVRKRAQALHLYWDETRIRILDHRTSPQTEKYSQCLYELRKHKGLTLSEAQKALSDSTYYGTMMVYQGDADGMVSGAVHTTAHTIKPALQFIKTKPHIQTVSSVFFMLLKDRVVLFSDCAVVPEPTEEQLAEIALSTAHTALSFGINPVRLGFLSYSSGDSGSGPAIDKIKKALQIATSKNSDKRIFLEGPLQYDAAVNKKVAAKKMAHSQVAGKTNVFIFPDLNTGNNVYKAVQRESNALAIGPVLQGLNKPVNDLSRGALVKDIYNTIIITMIQSNF